MSSTRITDTRACANNPEVRQVISDHYNNINKAKPPVETPNQTDVRISASFSEQSRTTKDQKTDRENGVEYTSLERTGKGVLVAHIKNRVLG